MRTLFLAPQPFFRERGSPIRALRQLEVLSRLGHEADVLCYPFGEDIALPGIRIIRTWRPPGLKDVKVGPSPAKFPLDLAMLLRAVQLCRRRRYAVIQAVEEAAFFAVWLKRAYGCRLIYNMDSYISDHLRYAGFLAVRPVLRLAAAFERAAMRAADCVVTVGSVLSDEVRRLAPGTRIMQLEDAPLDEEFHEDAAGAERLRRELGLSPGPVAVYAGNFSAYQGVDLLVRAAAHVGRLMPAARIVLAGGEPREIERMRALAAACGALPTLVFAGRRPTSEMRAFTTMACAMLSPRTCGTNPPLKIYPYLQSGRVIVATRLATHTQVLDDTCSILAEPEPAELAAGIVEALGNPARAAALAAAARARLAARYSLEIFRGKAQSLYETIAS